MRDSINELILGCAQELNNGREQRIPVALGGEAPLYGDQGVLDSLDLVTLVIAVEQAVEAQFSVTLTLADERALSRKQSPFRTVGSFADYIEELLRAVPT